MQLTVSKWGNSLAVRIPAEVARALALEEGAVVDCTTTPSGTLELIPASKKHARNGCNAISSALTRIWWSRR